MTDIHWVLWDVLATSTPRLQTALVVSQELASVDQAPRLNVYLAASRKCVEQVYIWLDKS